ncbi:MAG: NAD(P)/FAD-dependent oxidoreductase, partial [Pseudomonadota bacterium]
MTSAATKKPKPKSAIIIGGGHNGLIAAAVLARKGLRVDVLEANAAFGGGLALASSHMPLHPSVRKAAGLKKQSIKPVESIAIGPDGPPLRYEQLPEYKAFLQEYLSYSAALAPLMLNRPPRLKHFDWADAQTLGKAGWAIRLGLGKTAMQEFLRVIGMNIFDVLNEHFADERLKGAIAFDAVMGNHLAPRTPGTVLTYLMRLFHQGGNPRMPAGQTAAALEAGASSAGARLKPSSKVESILIEDDAAVGVKLAGGEELRADIVLSNADAKTTFLKLVGARHLDAMFTHRVSKTRTDGDVAWLQLTLKQAPEIDGLGPLMPNQRIVLSPNMRHLERAFNASKYGAFSEAPVLEMMANGNQLSITAAYAPFALKHGWASGASAFQEAVLSVLAPHMPGLKDQIDTSILLAPPDIAARYGSAGGHWHHGDIAFDQSF